MLSTFDGRTELDMDNNHIFPRCVLVSITLILMTGGGPDRVARDSTVYEVGLPLCSVAMTALSEVEVLSQVPGAEALRVGLVVALLLLLLLSRFSRVRLCATP